MPMRYGGYHHAARALSHRAPRHGWAPDRSGIFDHPKGLFPATPLRADGYEHIDPSPPISIRAFQYLGSFRDLGAMSVGLSPELAQLTLKHPAFLATHLRCHAVLPPPLFEAHAQSYSGIK
jgi:hypothetical protein